MMTASQPPRDRRADEEDKPDPRCGHEQEDQRGAAGRRHPDTAASVRRLQIGLVLVGKHIDEPRQRASEPERHRRDPEQPDRARGDRKHGVDFVATGSPT